MSVMNADKVKVILPRSGPDQFWMEIYRSYAGDDQRTWKYLAMFVLRVNGGWAVDQIGRAFGHPKGHVTRCLRRIEQELRERFAPPDDLWIGFTANNGESDADRAAEESGSLMDDCNESVAGDPRSARESQPLPGSSARRS